MSDHEDKDGIDGPFDRAMARAMKEDLLQACSRRNRKLLAILKKAAPAVAELHAQGYGCPDCDERDDPNGNPTCRLEDEIAAAIKAPE